MGPTKDGYYNGVVKEYYPSGEHYRNTLWSEGKLMDILMTFSVNGGMLPKGTLVNGTGLVYEYNEQGEKIEEKEYKDGFLVTDD